MRRIAVIGFLALACGSETPPTSAWAPPPVAAPSPPDSGPTAAPTPTPEDAPSPSPAVSRLRLVVPAATDAGAAYTVTVGQEVAATTVRSRRQANEGVAHLVVLTGSPTTEHQLLAIPGLTQSDVMADRFALGVIDGEGFRLLAPFTSDPGLLLPAARTLPTRTEDSPEPEVALYQGVLDALLAFRGERHIPATHLLTVISDGVDTAVRRRSVLERLASAIQSRAAAYEVVPRALLFGEPGAPHAALSALLSASRGRAALAGTSTESWEQATAALREDLQVLDVAAALPRGAVTTVTVRHGDREWSRALRGPEDEDQSTWPMAVPASAERVLPLGMASVETTRSLAQDAAAGGDALRAGALWHLVADALPESRQAHDESNQWDNRFRSVGAPIGTLVRGAERLPSELVVRVDLQFIHTLLREHPGAPDSARLLPPRRLPEPQPSDGPAPTQPVDPVPVTQLLLTGCAGDSLAACADDLLARRRWAHLVVDARGNITQLADLATAVAGGPAGVESVVIALSAPPFGASSEPVRTDSSSDVRGARCLRGFAIDASVTRLLDGALVRMPVADLTPGQSRALLPLLHTLGRNLPQIKLRFPRSEQERVVRARLVAPATFVGLVLEANVAGEGVDEASPGLPETLEPLARGARKLELRSQSTDMESWVDALASTGRREGAALRFARLGAPGVPLLIEVGGDARLDTLFGVVDALRAVASNLPKNAPEQQQIGAAFATWLPGLGARGAALEADGATVDTLQESLVEGLLELGAPAHLEAAVPLATAWLERAVEPPTAARRLVRPRALLAGCVLEARATPETAVALLAPLLEHAEPLVRSQALAGLLRSHATNPLGTQASALLADPDPWVRFLVARNTRPPGAIDALLGLRGTLPLRVLVNALREVSPDQPVPGVVQWFEQADDLDGGVVADAILAWKWVEVIQTLAPKLEDMPLRLRERTLALFRALTGRDRGSAAEGWLEWLAKRKPRAPHR